MTPDNASNWSAFGSFARLNMAADRLGPEIILSSDCAKIDGKVTLRRAVALYETGALEPASRVGEFLLVAGLFDELRERLAEIILRSTELWPDGPPDKECAEWIVRQYTAAEAELMTGWGEPVASLVQRQREDPEYFERVIASFDGMDDAACPNAST